MHAPTGVTRAFFVGMVTIVAAFAALADAANDPLGTVEVDLIFPRNETYAPSPVLPLVFAFRNAKPGVLLSPRITFTIWDRNNMSNAVVGESLEVDKANMSTNDPYFLYLGSTKFNVEGKWQLTWTLVWYSCKDERGNGIATNLTDNSMIFSTKNAAPQVDLVAASNDDKCSSSTNVALDITGTASVPNTVQWPGGETCAVVAGSETQPDPCRVKVDSAAASSMSASMTAQICDGLAPPAAVGCPKDDNKKNSAQRLLVGVIACVGAGLGAALYLLM